MRDDDYYAAYHTGDLLADVTRYVDDYDHVTMAELHRHWPEDFKDGDITTYIGGKNVVLWLGMTQAGATVLEHFLTAQRVQPCDWMSYMIDGLMLKLPLAKSNRNYKKRHWLPIQLRSSKANVDRRRGART